jgi:hypothetical protein
MANIHVEYYEKWGDCEDCGSFDYGHIFVDLHELGFDGMEYEWSTHMGPALPSGVDSFGSPYDTRSYTHGYVQALKDLGHIVSFEDKSNG